MYKKFPEKPTFHQSFRLHLTIIRGAILMLVSRIVIVIFRSLGYLHFSVLGCTCYIEWGTRCNNAVSLWPPIHPTPIICKFPSWIIYRKTIAARARFRPPNFPVMCYRVSYQWDVSPLITTNQTFNEVPAIKYTLQLKDLAQVVRSTAKVLREEASVHQSN